ncbi:MAG TPA: VOC family protein [Gemmatimonadales bacterium]|jgi:uncharacterized glyoxalase superfamily protein PhnB
MTDSGFTATELKASLTTKDLAKSLEWYHGVVGFAITNKYENEGKLRAASLQAGNIHLLLNQDDGKRGWTRVKGEGFALTFVTADVDGAAKRIKAKGGKLETEPADMPWGARMFRVLDPDGYKLAISNK